MAAGHDSVASMRAFFEEEGFLLFPRFLAEEHVARITADMDSIPEHHHIMRDNPRHWWGTGSLGSVETPHLGGLTSHPPAVAVVAAVAFGGFDFAVHHIHAHVHYEGDPGVHWRAPLGPGPHPCACWHPRPTSIPGSSACGLTGVGGTQASRLRAVPPNRPGPHDVPLLLLCAPHHPTPRMHRPLAG